MTPCTHSSQLSPFFLLFGQHMRTPLDTSLIPGPNLPTSVESYVKNVADILAKAKEIAETNIKKAQTEYSEAYDKRSKEPIFKIGDKVLLFTPKVPRGLSPKLFNKWSGPFYITRVGPNYTFAIRHASTHKEHTSLVHANRLKAYHDPIDRPMLFENVTGTPPENEQTDQITPEHNDTSQDETNKSNQEWLPVEKLLRTKMIQGKRHYLVKWRDEKPTWEPSENVSEALKRLFHISKTLKGTRRKRHVQRMPKY